jgi:glutathione S-transferase
MTRVLSALDWLEDRLGADGIIPGPISVQDIALTCLVLWTESRGPIGWRDRPRIEALVARLGDRPSFKATAPRPHVLK